MSIRAGHHGHFEDAIEMVSRRMANQFSREGKLVHVDAGCKQWGKK